MKKYLLISLAIILLLTLGYFLMTMQSPTSSSPAAVEQNKPVKQYPSPTTESAAPTPLFNTSDNLDEALQDLELFDQF